MTLSSPSLTLVTDRRLYRPRPEGKADPLSLVEAALDGGLRLVQLRARTASTDDLGLFAVALRLREMTQGRARFIVTGDLELAEKSHADGVLLTERAYKPSEARSFLRSSAEATVGAFVHSVAAAARAERGGADYVQVGPAFDFDPLSESEDGLTLLRKIKDAVQVPVIAFGGIHTPQHVVDCLRAGADGVAVTEAVTKASDPQAATAVLQTTIDAAWRALHGG
ncbi:MAG: thiamine phosphate synthase [Armatimonadota bacterium]|nr:thiamine phosphate synthase [Armatimonadota bacterium]